jgi:hypothetical protein
MIALPVLTPKDCYAFNTCNAPICPLDPGHPGSLHLKGERVCRFLLATGKAGAEEHYRGNLVFAEAKRRVAAIAATFPVIGRAVERAARQPLKRTPGRKSGDPVETTAP